MIVETSLETLDLPRWIYLCLRRAHITSVEDLADLPPGYLLGITGFGQKALEEVKAKLAERDLTLGPGTGLAGIGLSPYAYWQLRWRFDTLEGLQSQTEAMLQRLYAGQDWILDEVKTKLAEWGLILVG